MDIIAIINSNGNGESPWKISLWIFTSDRVCLPAANSTLYSSLAFVMKNITLSDILYIFRHSLLSMFVGSYHKSSYSLSMPPATLLPSIVDVYHTT